MSARKITAAKRKAAIAEILAAFDRVVASKHHDEELVSNAMHSIVGFEWSGWPNASMRAVLEAHAINAPAGDLQVILRSARAERKWVEHWDRRGWLECHVVAGRDLTLPALKRKAIERYPGLAEEIQIGSAARAA